MFTGIIEEVGRVVRTTGVSGCRRLEVKTRRIHEGLKIGDSISVNGVCLTLVGKDGATLAFDVMEETLKRSNLNDLRNGDDLNLEASLKAEGRIGGHMVSGHVDCMGVVRKISFGETAELEVEIPPRFRKYTVEKGSVTIDGISLTVGKVEDDRLLIYLIPHTLKMTNLRDRSAGDMLNIEFDIIGKYVVNAVESRNAKGGITEEFLKEKGFV